MLTYLAMYDTYAGVINDLTNLPPHMPGLQQPEVDASAKAAVATAVHLIKFISQPKSFF